MELLQKWLEANQWVQWVFSGIGLTVLSAAGRYFLNRKKPEPPPSSPQTAGDSSINQQGSGNTINQYINQPPENKKKAKST